MAHQEARDDETWAASVVHAAKGLFTGSEPAIGVIEHSPSCDSAKYLTLVMPKFVMSPEEHVGTLGPAGVRAFFYPPTIVRTYSEIERAASSGVFERSLEFRRQTGIGDAVGIFAYPEPGLVVCLFALHDREIRLARHERDNLSRLALHLETTYRLRRRPEVLKAVLDADGHVLERASDAPPAHVLAAHAENITRARRMADAEALELWPALVAGRMSIIERGSGSKRRYFVVENAPSTQPFRALSPVEVEVVSQAARGHSTKLIAYALGTTPSSVSLRLASAAAKVGASSRMELVRLAAMLTRDPRARFVDIVLTDAERDVLELLQQGLSNDEIAAIRSRSVRTIANQVASLLRKTNSASRRELALLPRTS